MPWKVVKKQCLRCPGGAACQTPATGLLGVQLTQLHDLEVQTCAAASSWETPDGHDSGVVAALSLEELQQHAELLRMRWTFGAGESSFF